MALKTVDLTQQPHRAIFTGCTQEEVNYAKTFWQSLQLLPPMESRLVSSDIKQRLRKAPPSRSMSESEKLDSFSSERGFSFSVSLSNSSKLSGKPNNSITVHPRPKVGSDSLTTQTSQIPNFGEHLGDICDKEETGPQDREKNNENPSHRKISVSAAAKPASGGKITAENEPCMLGAGGREFWSRWSGEKEEGAESGLTRTILPFSGEDLCRRKGFLNWGEKTFLSKLMQDTGTVECGGEELRGKRKIQYPASVVQKTPDCVTNPQAQVMASEKDKPPPQSQSPKIPRHLNKKKQRLVGKQQSVTSAFQSKNIAPDHFPHLVNSPSFVHNLLQPVLNALPDSMTKSIMPIEQEIPEIQKTQKAATPEIQKTLLVEVDKGNNKDSNTRKVSVKLVIESNDKAKVPVKKSQNKTSKLGAPESEHSIGVAHPASDPAVLSRPSKDLVFWTY